ncbi:MAG: phytanoyl-CoA dioxygenase family protein [Bacteroidetes bacterium]|nr:phytanoyl-CoA dioxygenase family protein [Bacteroidota bacterium]
MSKKQLYSEQGYVQINQLFNSAEVESLINAIKSASVQLPKTSSLNKTGLTFYSNVFKYSGEIRSILAQQKVVDLLAEISNESFWVRWDQCVEKHQNGEPFPLHRDNVYSKIPHEHLQFWIALSDMDEHNGSLKVVPKSHLFPPVEHIQNGQHWQVESKDYQTLTINAKRGDVIVFSSKLLHATNTNSTPISRWAYVVEFIPIKCHDPSVNPPYWYFCNYGSIINKMVDDLPFESMLSAQDLFQTQKPILPKIFKGKNRRNV